MATPSVPTTRPVRHRGTAPPRQARSARGRGPSGFTLVELMIALAILATVMALTFGTLRTGLRVWERGPAPDSELLGTRLRDLIETAYLVPVPQPDLRRLVPLRGSPSDLVWLRAEPPGTGPGGLHAWRIEAGPQGGLTLWHRAVAGPEVIFTPIDWGAPFARLGTLPPLRFSFAGADATWRDDWQPGPHPPRLIRLTAGDRRLPPLVIGLGVQP